MYFFLLRYSCLSNNADPDEISHHANFHLGVHCLSKYLFRIHTSIQSAKVNYHRESARTEKINSFEDTVTCILFVRNSPRNVYFQVQTEII